MKIYFVAFFLISFYLLAGQNTPKLTETKDSVYLEMEGKKYAFSHRQIALMRLEDAIANCNREEYSIALEHFDFALKYDAANFQIHYNKGLCLYFKEDYQNALESFNAALKLKPDDAKILNQRGMTLLQLDKTTDAIRDFTRSIELDTNYSNAYFNLGVVYLESYDFEKGCPFLKKAEKFGSEKAEQLYDKHCRE